MRKDIFAALTKVEEQDDGTIKVYGVASSGAKDGAGERITPEAMKSALPDYMAIGGSGALREMHQPSAAGLVPEALVDAEGITRIVAHVVDPLAITKVKTKTYKGFSVGGNVTSRDPDDPTIITGIKLVEISLVDRPCNPEAVINMWKADMAAEDQQMSQAAAAGAPTNDEVKAEATRLAKAAGKSGQHAYRDYVAKARENLIAKGGEEGSETAEEAAAPEVAGDLETPPGDAPDAADGGAEPAEAAEGDPAPSDEPVAAAEGEPEAADAGADKVDPAAALTAALEGALSKGAAAAEEAPGPFSDLNKAGAALAVIAKAAESDPLAKGLYTVGYLSRVLSELASVQADTVWEAEYEGDSSPIPQRLADAIASLGATLVAMAQEEVGELVAQMNERGGDLVIVVEDDCDGVFELATQIVDLVKTDEAILAKVGARNSKADQQKVQAIHDHIAKLGAVCDKGNCPDDKDAAADAGGLVKVQAENARLTDTIEKALPQIAELTKRLDDQAAEIERLRNEPVRKTAASAHARPVTKEADGLGAGSQPADGGADAVTPEQFKAALDSLPEAERGAVLLKVALANPKVLTNRPAAA